MTHVDLSDSALIVVDFQNDFCPGGALAVPHGDHIYPVVQNLIDRFHNAGCLTVFTRDYHPPHHISFVSQGGPWPPHCVQGTPGFEFFPQLKIPPDASHFFKGFQEHVDAYSGFEGHLVADGHITQLSLAPWLRQHDIQTVYIAGLATDYCVRATTLDAIQANFETIVVINAIKGVNVHPRDSENALDEMKTQGAHFIEWAEDDG